MRKLNLLWLCLGRWGKLNLVWLCLGRWGKLNLLCWGRLGNLSRSQESFFALELLIVSVETDARHKVFSVLLWVLVIANLGSVVV